MRVRPFSYSFVVPISLLAFVSSSCSKEAPAFTSASAGTQDLKETGVDSSEANASGRRDGSDSEGSMDSGLPPNPDALFGPQAGRDGDPSRSGSPDTTGNQVGGAISGELSSSGGTGTATQNPTAEAISKTFEVKTTEAISGAFFVNDGWTSQPLMLTSRSENATSNFTQLVRPIQSASFKQGQGAKLYREAFNQAQAAGVLDILVVVDNSGSMKEEQVNLSTKLSPLLNSVGGADWRIGVVTTDPNDGCQRALITKGQADASATFEAAVNAGVSGSANERGVLQSVAGLSCPSSQWVRPNSTVAVLIVSDEDNCSAGGGDCGTDPWNSEKYLLDHLTKNMNRKLGTDARVYGLFRHPSDSSCTTAPRSADQYAAAVAASSGTWGSICAADYSSTLQAISNNVAAILKQQFALQSAPNPSTLRVYVTDQSGTRTQTTAYTLAGNVLTFTTPPPLRSTIDVEYYTPEAPQLSAFDLGSPAYMGSVSVTLDGVAVPANAFSVAGQTLSFAAPPPPDSQIAASFKKDIPLVSSFGLGIGVVASTLQVKVDGQAAQGVTFDAATGTLKFTPAPGEGAVIEATFRRLTVAETKYPILLSSQAITEVRAQYEDNTPVAVTISTDGVQNYVNVTAPAQVRVGSNLWVQYRVAGQTANAFMLPSTPIPGTLVLTSSVETCKVGNDITVSGNTIQVKCPGASMLKISFAFERYLEPKREFVFTGVDKPDSLTWEVFVDGKALIEAGLFRREGNTIILSPQVPLENSSLVAIRAYLKQM
jgi:hypothetical protein